MDTLTKSERITENLVRIIWAVCLAFAAAGFVFMLLALLAMPLQRFDSLPFMFYGVRAFASFAQAFAFVFAGSLIVVREWRVITAIGLLWLGLVFYLFFYRFMSSDDLFPPVWEILSSIAGGIVAVVNIRRRRGKAA